MSRVTSLRREKTQATPGFFKVETMGLEPTTSCLQSRCSSQLSYVPENSGNEQSGRCLTSSVDSKRCHEVPVAHTPEGGWTGEMPAPILAGCDDPIADGAPDLRGTWQVVAVEADGKDVVDHPVMGHVQRVEQCGDRLVVTASGIIHDMRCDGTEEHGVHDVAEFDHKTPITVVASYESGVHVLRPVGLPIEVTRRRDGDQMVWNYFGFEARLVPID